MHRFQYLAVLAACVAITVPLEVLFGARVWRRPRLLARVVLPVAAVFVAWDAVAVARHHWSFNARYVLGWEVLGLPVEEVLFFLVVPVCGLLTYDAFNRFFAGERAPFWRWIDQRRAGHRTSKAAK